MTVAYRRLVRKSSGKRAAGAVAAQLSQALASFALQFVAARSLGARGLGVFAILYGAIVLGTAICTGMVGDSLTVLDRAAPAIRAGLQSWTLVLSSVAGLAAALITGLSGLLTPGAAVLFGAATVVFIIEDALRRTLMAVLRFWSLPVVDLTSLVASLATLGVVVGLGRHLTVGQFMFALLIGQIVASAAAVMSLPLSERIWAPLRGAAMAQVVRFGAWRAAQQAVRPAMLTAIRLLITAMVGAAAYGQLEAARVYMAPALLVVSGMGSFLLPMYVSRRTEAPARIQRRADLAAAGLLASCLVLGVAATAATPLLGNLITGGSYHLSALAVFAWSVYAASTAAVMPYGTLAAVLGKQAAVMGLRLLDPLVATAGVAGVLFVWSGAVAWTPIAIASGSFVSGAAIRQLILLPRVRSFEATRAVDTLAGPAALPATSS